MKSRTKGDVSQEAVISCFAYARNGKGYDEDCWLFVTIRMFGLFVDGE